jgi:1,4-alpha-glucan branching enzyme
MWLFGKEIYENMSSLASNEDEPFGNAIIQRGLSLHKMIRAITMCLGGESWLNFMGNEFGHPEWIDFPREGNDWSHEFCRRQWTLADMGHLRYSQLGEFDRQLMSCEDQFEFLADMHQMATRIDDEKKIIVAERGPLVFVFNFNVSESFEGLEIGCGMPGKYQVVLDSDRLDVGGLGRVAWHEDHFTAPKEVDGRPCSLMVNSPARTVVAYAKVPEGGDSRNNVVQGGRMSPDGRPMSPPGTPSSPEGRNGFNNGAGSPLGQQQQQGGGFGGGGGGYNSSPDGSSSGPMSGRETYSLSSPTPSPPPASGYMSDSPRPPSSSPPSPPSPSRSSSPSGGLPPAGVSNVERLVRENKVAKLTVEDLKNYLREKGLKVSGRKIELIARVREYLLSKR